MKESQEELLRLKLAEIEVDYAAIREANAKRCIGNDINYWLDNWRQCFTHGSNPLFRRFEGTGCVE